MPYLLIIAGLPSSGKSHEAKRNEKLIGKCTVYDDYSKNNSGFEALINSIKNKENIIITDPYLCIDRNMDRLFEIFEEYDPEQVYSCDVRYFENDPEKCYVNAAKRLEREGDKKVSELIKYLAKQYNPKGGLWSTIKVWREND